MPLARAAAPDTRVDVEAHFTVQQPDGQPEIPGRISGGVAVPLRRHGLVRKPRPYAVSCT